MKTKNNALAKSNILSTDLILRQVAPLPVQPIGPETGLFKGFVENWKLEQRAKSTALIREIAQNQAATTAAYASSMFDMMTFSRRCEHSLTMMDLDRQLKTEDLIEKRLKNKKLHHEANQEEIAEKIKLKQFEELYGPSTSEDRD
jgi:hypothetical protein